MWVSRGAAARGPLRGAAEDRRERPSGNHVARIWVSGVTAQAWCRPRSLTKLLTFRHPVAARFSPRIDRRKNVDFSHAGVRVPGGGRGTGHRSLLRPLTRPVHLALSLSLVLLLVYPLFPRLYPVIVRYRFRDRFSLSSSVIFLSETAFLYIFNMCIAA